MWNHNSVLWLKATPILRRKYLKSWNICSEIFNFLFRFSKRYPFYIFGCFMIISSDLLPLLVNCNRTCLPVEDVSIGICLANHNVNITEIKYIYHAGHVGLETENLPWAVRRPDNMGPCRLKSILAIFHRKNQAGFFRASKLSSEMKSYCWDVWQHKFFNLIRRTKLKVQMPSGNISNT